MISRKNKKTKETLQRPIAKSKSMIVPDVCLPMALERKEKKGQKFLWTLLMMGVTACVWAWLVFTVVDMFSPKTSCSVPKVAPAHVKVEAPVVPIEPEYPENVVAVVADEPITIEEVREFIKQVPQLTEVPFEQIYPKMLDLYINNKVVALGADEMMIPQDPDVQRAIKMAEEQIITQAYLTAVLDQAITESDLKEYYDEQVKAFQSQEEIHARHILLPSEEQARNALIQLQAGADFAALANQKSLDKNAKDGDLGYFTHEMMIPEFAEAVFNMQKNELSAPVRTAFGYHIIQVLDKRQTTPPKFEDVKEQMRQAVMERKIPQILDEERTKRNVKIIRPKMK